MYINELNNLPTLDLKTEFENLLDNKTIYTCITSNKIKYYILSWNWL